MTVELTPVTALGATYHFQDPLFVLGLMFPFKQWTLSTLHPTQSSTQIHTHTHTLPPKICCIFVSSSGTISWCQACVVWSDSHALCSGVEGWMNAQSTIALINTNSYARCSQVSISSRCSFSLGAVAHFRQLSNSLIPFSLFVRCRKEKNCLAQTAREISRDWKAFSYMRTSFGVVLCLCWTLYSKPSQCTA